MWLITNFGFFSVVQKPADKHAGTLTVRARVKGDLESLRERYLPSLGEISTGAGTDYRYRATAPREAVAAAFQQALLDLDYSNFKSAVAATQGGGREHYYHQMWDIHYAMQNNEAKLVKGSKARTSPAASATTLAGTTTRPGVSYGGVIFDDEGRVLLREPSGHYDGYVWTFSKGRPDRGESQEAAALREVLEETGCEAKIVAKVPGSFKGGTGSNEYFLMRSANPLCEPTNETASVRWATPEDAALLISKSTNKLGRNRDLAVLEAAVKAWREQNGAQ